MLLDKQKRERLARLRGFIKSNPDTRDLKRALAVKMALEGKAYSEISQLLEISYSSICRWKQQYLSKGIEGIQLCDRGTKNRFPSSQQKQEIISWLSAREHWVLEELITHLKEEYGIVYKTQQRYYELFKSARASMGATQK
jgi:putative transposase